MYYTRPLKKKRKIEEGGRGEGVRVHMVLACVFFLLSESFDRRSVLMDTRH